jgi:Na+:H+ antiporter, NhaA family
MKSKSNSKALVSWEGVFETIRSQFDSFLHHQLTGGIILFACTIVALIMANSALADEFYAWFHISIQIHVGDLKLDKSIHLWINELLMAFFFLLMGLEIKREVIVGELSSFRKALLPIVAALGGVILPAGIYLFFNPTGLESKGWGIPMATDIAFVVGVMTLIRKYIPKSLFTIIIAIAIVDDIAAVMVIAIFYTAEVQWIYMIWALVVVLVLVILNRFRIQRILPFMLLGGMLWLCFYSAHIHVTLAGVVLAFTIPACPRYEAEKFHRHMLDLLKDYKNSFQNNPSMLTNSNLTSLLTTMWRGVNRVQSPLIELEHTLAKPVSFIIVPLFALANAGVALGFESFTTFFSHSITIGVVLGLLLGKSAGLFLSMFLAERIKLIALPPGINLGQLLGVSFLAGIGFTMSIFIADLAFEAYIPLFDQAKKGIILGSVLSAGIGVIILVLFRRRRPNPRSDDSPSGDHTE